MSNINFNPRSRVGNDRQFSTFGTPPFYFNPRSRVGNDNDLGCFYSGNINFNPRSRVGNDASQKPRTYFVWDFNPRSRVGNDYLPMCVDDYIRISIHVPAWGTTRRYVSLQYALRFQSTFPRGERPEFADSGGAINNFNPRSRVGNDGCFFGTIPEFRISIHVPAWGTTFGYIL